MKLLRKNVEKFFAKIPLLKEMKLLKSKILEMPSKYGKYFQSNEIASDNMSIPYCFKFERIYRTDIKKVVKSHTFNTCAFSVLFKYEIDV